MDWTTFEPVAAMNLAPRGRLGNLRSWTAPPRTTVAGLALAAGALALNSPSAPYSVRWGVVVDLAGRVANRRWVSFGVQLTNPQAEHRIVGLARTADERLAERSKNGIKPTTLAGHGSRREITVLLMKEGDIGVPGMDLAGILPVGVKVPTLTDSKRFESSCPDANPRPQGAI